MTLNGEVDVLGRRVGLGDRTCEMTPFMTMWVVESTS